MVFTPRLAVSDGLAYDHFLITYYFFLDIMLRDDDLYYLKLVRILSGSR